MLYFTFVSYFYEHLLSYDTNAIPMELSEMREIYRAIFICNKNVQRDVRCY